MMQEQPLLGPLQCLSPKLDWFISTDMPANPQPHSTYIFYRSICPGIFHWTINFWKWSHCKVPKCHSTNTQCLSAVYPENEVLNCTSWQPENSRFSCPPYIVHNQPKLYLNNILIAAWRHSTRTMGPITCIHHNNEKRLITSPLLVYSFISNSSAMKFMKQWWIQRKGNKSESTRIVKCVMQPSITMNEPGFNPDVFQTQGEHITEEWINLVKRISGTQN
jgi:hypothetical protein